MRSVTGATAKGRRKDAGSAFLATRPEKGGASRLAADRSGMLGWLFSGRGEGAGGGPGGLHSGSVRKRVLAQRTATAWHTRLLQAEEALRRAREGATPEGQAAIDDASSQIERAKLDMYAAADMAETLGQLDQLVWNAWSKKIAPDSAVTREGAFSQALARVLSEADDERRGKALEETTRALASTRRMTAALIAAIAQAAERYASRHVMRFGVDSIEKVSAAENGRTGARLGNQDAIAWRKYKELMGETAGASEANIEAEILRSVAEFAESLAGTFASAEKDSLSQSQREAGGGQ